MLDIYLLDDSEEIPDYPDEKSYLGSLKLEHHKALYALWELCNEKSIQLKYFEDSHLSYKEVMMVFDCIKELSNLQKSDIKIVKEAYSLIKSIIEKAAKESSGVVSFCD